MESFGHKNFVAYELVLKSGIFLFDFVYYSRHHFTLLKIQKKAAEFWVFPDTSVLDTDSTD